MELKTTSQVLNKEIHTLSHSDEVNILLSAAKLMEIRMFIAHVDAHSSDVRVFASVQLAAWDSVTHPWRSTGDDGRNIKSVKVSGKAPANAMNCTVQNGIKDWNRTHKVFFDELPALLESTLGDSLEKVNKQEKLFWTSRHGCCDDNFCEDLMLLFESDVVKTCKIVHCNQTSKQQDSTHKEQKFPALVTTAKRRRRSSSRHSWSKRQKLPSNAKHTKGKGDDNLDHTPQDAQVIEGSNKLNPLMQINHTNPATVLPLDQRVCC